jgi:DnaA family protein
MRDIAADTAAVLPGLERLDLVCLDDIDALAGREEGERALFHLFNRMRESGSVLLVAASAPAQQCGFRLPDLVSRLGWGLTYRLRSLDDGAVLAALLHRARARGLELSEETAVFLLKRIPRDLPTVFSALDRLDEAAMVEQRRLTIPFVKSILNLV